MFSKSILAAAVLAGASAVTAYEHPTFHGHGGPHPCKTTSTVVVYATETATVYEGAGGEGGWGSGSTAAGGASASGSPTWGGGAPAGPATVTVTATYSVDANGQGHTWGPGGDSASSTSSVGSGSGFGGNGGFGGGYGSGSTTSTSTSTSYGSGPTGTPGSPSGPLCLTNATASYLTNGYGQLLSAYTNDTANSLLAADFTDTSDSINWLAGIPLGGATFGSKAAFIAGQGTQPAIGFSVQSIMFSCTQVAFRWTATLGMKKFPAKGINMFTASNLNGSEAGWQIQTMYSEFDVGAWEVNIGRTCTPQGANIAGS